MRWSPHSWAGLVTVAGGSVSRVRLCVCCLALPTCVGQMGPGQPHCPLCPLSVGMRALLPRHRQGEAGQMSALPAPVTSPTPKQILPAHLCELRVAAPGASLCFRGDPMG